MSNLIPAIGTRGSFVVLPPFDQVCRKDIVFTVEAIRTVDELRLAKVNVAMEIGHPVGLTPNDTQSLLTSLEVNNGLMITLIAPGVGRVHVPSTYFESFPLIDGVAYERYFLTVDLGSLPPSFSEGVNTLKEQLREQVKSFTGVESPVVHLGSMKTVQYVSKEQNLVNETTRKNRITKEESYLETIKRLEQQHVKDKTYIALLESKLIEQQKNK